MYTFENLINVPPLTIEMILFQWYKYLINDAFDVNIPVLHDLSYLKKAENLVFHQKSFFPQNTPFSYIPYHECLTNGLFCIIQCPEIGRNIGKIILIEKVKKRFYEKENY